MGTEIKIEIEELTNELERLNKAIAEFEPYSAKFMKNTIASLGDFNSDFIEKIKDTLENMTDTKAPELLKEMKQFYEDAIALVKELKERDEKLAGNSKVKK